MLRRLRQLLTGQRKSVAPAPDLLPLERDAVSHLWHRPDGLPRIDWEMANLWLHKNLGADGDMRRGRRSLMAACLVELRDALPQDHRCWRSANVEGLAPLDGGAGPAIAGIAERSYKRLHADLRPVRGDAPIPPIAIIAVTPQSSYLDFINSYYPDTGEFATSGGIYLNDGDDCFPIVGVNAVISWGCEATVVHELTHHALYDADLPHWVEEGFTQMMEERIARHGSFKLDAEMVSRQRELWSQRDLDTFLDGSSFSCPEDDTQELAYHLAQWVVRSQLAQRPDVFFRFTRACRDGDAERQFERILGTPMRELVAETIGVEA